MTQLKVINIEGQLLVDSRDVAEMTGKQHKDLLETIRVYIKHLISGSFRPFDFFIESEYRDTLNRNKPCYLLTRKGCDMIANKMTGEKGVLFTATYVTRFEEMEKKLQEINKPSYMIDDPVKRAEKWIEEQKEKLMLEQRVAEYEPKATYLDTILNTKDTVTISQIADDYGMSAKALNKKLHELGVQYKINKQWLLYSKYKGEGYTKSNTVPITHKNGTQSVEMHTKWTQKGRLFIYETLKKQNIFPLMDIDVDRNLRLVSGISK